MLARGRGDGARGARRGRRAAGVGTSAKSLQVGFAAEAGVRAAALAQAGASADVLALDDWMGLGLAGTPRRSLRQSGRRRSPGVWRSSSIRAATHCSDRSPRSPIWAWTLPAAEVRGIRVTTPATSLAPLIHRLPSTGLEGKFSLEYAVAAVLLDGRPGLGSFTDEAVGRPEAVRLAELVETVPLQGGADLLVGEVEIEVTLAGGERLQSRLELPPGAPGRPPTDEELRGKLELCAGGEADRIAALSWETAAGYVHNRFMA